MERKHINRSRRRGGANDGGEDNGPQITREQMLIYGYFKKQCFNITLDENATKFLFADWIKEFNICISI